MSNFTYTVNSDGTTATITDYTGSQSRVIIPSVVDGYSVTNIGNSVFEGCKHLTSITISENVTSIGSYVFNGCTKLEKVNLPADLTTIGHYAFQGCSSLEEILLPDMLTTINAGAFSGTAIESITIPKRVTTLYNTPSGYTYEEGHFISAFKGAESLRTVIFEEGILTIPERALKECTQVTNVIIPDSVTTIGSRAFANCTGLAEIEIPNSVTTISSYAFSGCKKFEVINLPDNLTSIGSYVFSGCTGLSGITIPDKVISISSYAFNGCTGITEMTLHDKVTSIGSYAFNGCTNLDKVNLSADLTTIGQYAFQGCSSLKEIILPEMLTTINAGAFSGTAIESITIPKRVTTLYNTPSGYTYQESHFISAFKGAESLRTVIFEEGILTIPVRALKECTQVTNVVLPDSITSIGSSAFSGCTGLTEVYYVGAEEQWNTISISSGNDTLINATIHFSHSHNFSDCEIIYESTCSKQGLQSKKCSVCGYVVTEVIKATGHSYLDVWTIDVEATCTEPGKKSHHCTACGDRTDITEISATGHNYVIVNEDLDNSHSITYKCSYCGDEKTAIFDSSSCIECNFTLTLIDSTYYKLVSYIGTQTAVVIPANHEGVAVTTIANSCFKGNTEIICIEIEEGVTTIGSLAFMNCTALEKVVIPASVTSIGTQAFYGFTGTIYCTSGSVAHEYAVANNIKYVLQTTDEPAEPIQDTVNTQIDYDNFMIFTSVKNSGDIAEILGLSESATVVPTASYVYGNLELYGTGTVITVFYGNDYIGDFTLIVEGDLNGDSVVDVLDAAAAQLYSAGFHEPTENEILAANGCISDVIDVNSYQNVVNTCLAS